MAILVTGGAGYVGSHLVAALVEAGEKTVVLDDLSGGSRKAVHPNATLIVGDIGDRTLVGRVLTENAVEAVIHLAAKVVVARSLVDPVDYYHSNTVKSHALITAVVAAKIKRFVFSSSAAVYGAPLENPISEDAPLRPQSPYGSSKLMTEWMLRDIARAEGMSYVVLRYFNVAGADPSGRLGQRTSGATSLIKVVCEAALGVRSGLDVFGTDYPTSDGTALRDYVHVSDVAAAHLAALEHLRLGRGNLTVNCGCGRGSSVFQVIETVKRISGTNFVLRHLPPRAGDPAVAIATIDRIQSTLNWSPKFGDLSTIVGHALAWERKLAT